MLFRKIYSELEHFYSENSREALLVTGARQIGKSFAIREFGKSHFENFIEIGNITKATLRRYIRYFHAVIDKHGFRGSDPCLR